MFIEYRQHLAELLKRNITFCSSFANPAQCPPLPPLFASNAGHNRSKRLHIRIRNNVIREPVLLPSPQQILDHLIGFANKDRRHLQNILDSNATPPPFTRDLFGSFSSPLTENWRNHHAQFQLIKAFSCGLANPLDFLRNRLRQTFRDLLRNGTLRQCFRKDAHNTGLPSGKRQHPLASSTHQNWRVRPLDRFGKSTEVCGRIVVASEAQWLVGKEPLQHVDTLFQPAHAHSCWLKGQASLLVLGTQPTRSNPKLESSIREQIKRRSFFRQHHRVPVVVVKHQASNPQCPCNTGGRH